MDSLYQVTNIYNLVRRIAMKKKSIVYLLVLISILFAVNFLFTRFVPNTIKENLWLSALIVAGLDGVMLLILDWIFKRF